MKKSTAKLIERLRGGSKVKTPSKRKRGLSTGSTLVNLAFTGHAEYGLTKGSYYLLVGDSQSGKTFLALTSLAEATIHPNFANYRLIYDAPERGARMDMKKFFGTKMPARLENRYSETVEDFYYGLDDLFDEEKPFIYVLDSESSLSSKDEDDKRKEQKVAYHRGREAPGSYGDGKAKKHSSNIRQVIPKLEKSGSILILISQTRDNIGFGAQFNPKVRSGGKALKFYATDEAWFSIKGSIKKTVMGKPRTIGKVLQVQVKKNRDTGREPVI